MNKGKNWRRSWRRRSRGRRKNRRKNWRRSWRRGKNRGRNRRKNRGRTRRRRKNGGGGRTGGGARTGKEQEKEEEQEEEQGEEQEEVETQPGLIMALGLLSNLLTSSCWLLQKLPGCPRAGLPREKGGVSVWMIRWSARRLPRPQLWSGPPRASRRSQCDCSVCIFLAEDTS